MSQAYLRTTLINELQTLLNAQVPAVPFYDTINQRQKPTDPLWVTVEFYPGYSESICYGDQKRIEYGTVDIDVYGKAGKSDTPVIQLADAVMDHFFNLDITNDLQITGATAPSENTVGDAAPWYGVTVSLDYQYYL